MSQEPKTTSLAGTLSSYFSNAVNFVTDKAKHWIATDNFAQARNAKKTFDSFK